MELILKKDMAELVPQRIEWNNEELKQMVVELVKPFETQLFSDDTIPEAKEARAKLNNLSKKLNTWRIENSKIYTAPLDVYKQQVDEIKAIIDNASLKIDNVVKEYESRKAADKLDEITDIFKAVFETYLNLIDFKTLYNAKWMTKAYTLDKIKAEFEERKATIDGEVDTLKTLVEPQDLNRYLAIYFQTLNLPLTVKEYKRQKEYEAYVKQATQPEEKPTTTESIVEPKTESEKATATEPEPDMPFPNVEEKKYCLIFSVKATKAQLLALRQFFVENNIEYKKEA